jgi:hypothetical protein
VLCAERLRAGALGKTIGFGAGAAHAEEPEQAPEPEEAAMPLAPAKQYAANIGSVVRALTRSRAGGQLLHEAEWAAYEAAIASGRCQNWLP